MYIQKATGKIKVFNTWMNLVEISKVSQNSKSPDDRFFIDTPLKISGTNFSRKSFLRSELQGYKKV